MKVRKIKVTRERLINLENFQSERIGQTIEVELEEGDKKNKVRKLLARDSERFLDTEEELVVAKAKKNKDKLKKRLKELKI